MKWLIFVLVIAPLLSSGIASAQELSIGTPATQAVKIEIDESGNAHVTHTVERSTSTQQLSVIRDDFTNLQISDEGGGSAEFAEISGATTTFLFFPTNARVLVEYDLENAVTETNGLWVWNYLYTATTAFYLPEGTQFVFANTNPVSLKETGGVRCHGCQLTLEYELKDSEKTQQITWEDKTFTVRIFATGVISELRFDQPNKMISLDVEKDQYVTLMIPKELLWNPYHVFLNEKTILQHEFYQTEDEVWLNFKPNEDGKVDIVGVSAVPEFPLATVLVLGAAMIVVAKLSNKLSLR